MAIILTMVACSQPPEVPGSGMSQDEFPANSVGSPVELKPKFVLGLDSIGGDGPTLLYRSNSVALDADGNIYVLDGGNQRVVVFDEEGRRLFEFGRAGQGPGEFFLGADMGDEIVVSDDRVFVMEKQRQRIQSFTTSGEYISSFTLSEITWKIAVWDGLVYVSLQRQIRGRPTVAVYTADGTFVRALGQTLFDRNEARVDRLNMNYTAVGSDGTVKQAFQYLPVMRTLRDDGSNHDAWFDFSWWDNAPLRAWVTRGNSKEVFTELLTGGHDVDTPRRVVFWDLEYSKGASEWWVIMYNSIAQSFSDDGQPRRAFLLRLGEGEDERADPQDLGIDPRGGTLCAADRKASVVRCYDISTNQ